MGKVLQKAEKWEAQDMLTENELERYDRQIMIDGFGKEGQATTIIPGKTPCLRCICPEPPPEEKFPVIGVAPAVIGCIQATEAIKYVLQIGELLTGRLLIYDGLGLRFFEVDLYKDPECKECSR